MSMLDKVKVAMRITHDKLDDEIRDNIISALEEMERAGVPQDIAKEPENYPLVAQAVKTYCQARGAIDQNQAERYMESFNYQLDNLRKSSIYRESEADAE